MKHDIRASEEKKPVASFISSQFFYCQHAIYNVVSVVSIHTHPNTHPPPIPTHH